MGTTIRDVAADAGVSTATVSRVLAGWDNVASDLRDRVMASVRALDYRPNSVARNLRTRANTLLGLVIPDITNPFFTSVARGLEDAAHALGFSVVLANADGDPTKEERYLEAAMTGQLSGVVIAPASTTTSRRVERLLAQAVPVVVLDQRLRGVSVDSVRVNNRVVARQATEHLLAEGCQRIGMVAGPSSTSTGADRLAGYRAALRSVGIGRNDEHVVRANFQVDGGYQAAHTLLERAAPPDGFLVANNRMTVGVLDALADRGLTCPHDLALVGFDDLPPFVEHRHRVSVIRQPAYELGATAADLVVSRMRGSRADPRHVVLEAALLIRESSRRTHTS